MHRREFDLLVPLNHVKLEVRPAKLEELPRVFDIAQQEIPALSACLRDVEAVVRRNSDSILVYDREGKVVGVYAMLMLSERGLERLLAGELDTSSPDMDAMVGSGQPPTAIYNWAVVAPKLASEGLRHTSVYLRRPIFRHADIYARGTTKAARRIMEHGGYQLLGGIHDDLYRYVRVANRPKSLPFAA